MFGLFKKRTPALSPKLNKVQLAEVHITSAATLATDAFEHDFVHEPHLQWEGAQRWFFYCATIPAFGLIITFEMIGESLTPTSEQHAFFKAVEDKLFEIYRQDHSDSYGTIRNCLRLATERDLVCNTLHVDENTNVKFDLLLGIIFPNRLHIYQRDWACGFGGVLSPARYAAMRFVADMTGIATPPSLQGYTANDLNRENCGSAIRVLTEFGASYLKARKEFRSA